MIVKKPMTFEMMAWVEGRFENLENHHLKKSIYIKFFKYENNYVWQTKYISFVPKSLEMVWLEVVEVTGGSSKSNKFTSFCAELLELEVTSVFLSEDVLNRLLLPILDLLSSDGEILPLL